MTKLTGTHWNHGKPDQNELRELVQNKIAAFGMAAAFHGINKTNPIPPDPTAEIMELVQTEVLAAIEKTFPHLWGEYNSYEDEQINLELSADFDSFFRHERVQKYLAQLKDTK